MPDTALKMCWVCLQAIPCAVVALIAHPGTHHNIVFRVRSCLLRLLWPCLACPEKLVIHACLTSGYCKQAVLSASCRSMSLYAVAHVDQVL